MINLRIKINNQILNEIKQKIVNYFLFDQTIVNRVDYNYKDLYIENLLEKTNVLMVCRANEIAIDKSFFLFDNKENVVSFDNKVLKLIKSQLGHELLHMFSRKINNNKEYNGINIYDLKNKFYINNYVGLNEGITQMFTEDVFGYVVSPFTDGYKDFKKVAKIMRLCLGNEVFIKSYFYHNNSLREECNRLSGNNCFEHISKSLTDMYYLKKTIPTNSNSYKQVAIKIYNKRIKACFSNVIINLVLPKLNSMNTIEEKKRFIKEILKVVSDDKEREKEIEYLLNKLINVSSENLEFEKRKINSYETKLIQKEKLLNPPSNKSLFSINENGDIYYIKNQNFELIKEDIELCEYLYSSLYSYYFKFNIDTIINQLKNEKNDPKLIFPSNYGIKRKRIMFSKIKTEALEKHGIVILNNYLECEKNEIKIKYVNNSLEFKDLKELSNRFKLEREKYFDSWTIIDKVTKKKIYNKTIINGVKIAYLWENLYNNDKNLAYNKINEKIYDDMISHLIKNLELTGNLNYKDIYNYALSNNPKLIRVLKTFFKTPITYEWLYSFVSSKVERTIKNFEKEKSIVEKNSEYIENVLNLKVEQILKK